MEGNEATSPPAESFPRALLPSSIIGSRHPSSGCAIAQMLTLHPSLPPRRGKAEGVEEFGTNFSKGEVPEETSPHSPFFSSFILHPSPAAGGPPIAHLLFFAPVVPNKLTLNM